MALRFCDEADLTKFVEDLDEVYPRQRPDGTEWHSWGKWIDLAMTFVARDLRSRRVYTEPFEIGRVGLRSREHLRDAVACQALAFIFDNLNTVDGAPGGVYDTKSKTFQRMARDILDAEAVALDYDESGDDAIDDGEKQRPHPAMFIRG